MQLIVSKRETLNQIKLNHMLLIVERKDLIERLRCDGVATLARSPVPPATLHRINVSIMGE